MIKTKFSSIILVLIAAILIIGTFGCDDPPVEKPDEKGVRPIVFVHGLAGSGDQFQAQALRFASNGYPEHFVFGFDHNSLYEPDRQENLKAFIKKVIAQTGYDKIDLAGHSMGTSISQEYLEDEEQAAQIAHYINIDGVGEDYLPGGVPTLNIMATGIAAEIPGAINIQLTGNTHVQAVSSPVVFAHMYEFLTGDAPATTDILPSSSSNIEIQGRLVIFISNTVPENGYMNIYEVDPNTGHRLNPVPVYSQLIDMDGYFGFTGKRYSAYEFKISRPSQPEQGHYYYEPFVRSDYLVRLKYSEPGSTLYDAIERDTDAAALVIIRNREFQGSNDSDTGVDSIKINGLEACEDVLSGGDGVMNSGPIGIIVYDRRSDNESNLDYLGILTWDATVDWMPFLSILDHYMPGNATASGTNTVVVTDRFTGRVQTIQVPTWESTTHTSMVQFLPY